MKCSIETFLLGLLTGVITCKYDERNTRNTMRCRKIRREINKTILDLYGSAEQQIGRIKEKVGRSADDTREMIDEAIQAAK